MVPSWLTVALVVALPSTCAGEAPTPAAVPFVDQVAWFEELSMHRPGLMMQHGGDSIYDPAWQAVVIRPEHRHELISDRNATYRTILEREYSSEERAVDASWAEELRDAQLAALPDSTRTAPKRIETYSSYWIGPPRRLRDDRGYTYKTFFELDDFLVSLGPDRVTGFAQALETAGFVGAFIIDLRPGQVRFQYNNLIVLAASTAMADCALASGLSFFAGDLLHVGRGVDVSKPTRSLDWHHFLLTGEFPHLPADVRAFARSRQFPSPNVCPEY